MAKAETRAVSDIREHLERFREVTLQTLEWVPEEKLHFSPQEGLRPFDEHFLHIARTEEYHVRGLLLGDWSPERYNMIRVKQYRGQLPTPMEREFAQAFDLWVKGRDAANQK